MHHRPRIGRVDAHGGVHARGRGPADQQRLVHPQPRHLFGDVHHLVQRRRDQPAQADHVGVLVDGGLQDLLGGRHHAQVDDLIVVAPQHDAHDILADVVHVAFDGGHQDASAGSWRFLAGVGFLLLHERFQVGHRSFHHAGRLDDLGQKHLAGREQIADLAHAVHQRPFDDLQAAVELLPRFFRVLFDEPVDAFDQGLDQPLFDGARAPGKFLFRRFLALRFDGFGEFHQPLGGVRAPVQQHVLNPLQQFRRDFFVDRQLAGVDDAHVQAGADRVVQECGMDRLADRVVAAKRERNVADAAGDFHAGQRGLDAPRRLDEVDRVGACSSMPVPTVRMFGSKMMSSGGNPASSVRMR